MFELGQQMPHRFAALASVAGGAHPGAGASVIDGGFPEAFLASLDRLLAAVPETPPSKPSCSARHYCFDADGRISAHLARAVAAFRGAGAPPLTRALPAMRFLYYSHAGGTLAPHTDLGRKEAESGAPSTHTFVLFLRTCAAGGATALLGRVAPPSTDDGSSSNVLAAVAPVRGRLLVFPHACPHAGLAVVDAPKVLLRGEML